MSEDGSEKSVSLINLGSLTKPIDTLSKGLIDGAGAFLSRICLPAVVNSESRVVNCRQFENADYKRYRPISKAP
jgi:hypothetical protein